MEIYYGNLSPVGRVGRGISVELSTKKKIYAGK
jgi:hypothetical protein